MVGTQAESPWLLPEVVKNLIDAARSNFRYVDYAAISVPTYPTGMIGCCTASDTKNVAVPAAEPDDDIARKLRYYNRRVHEAAFAKPQFVAGMLGFES